MLVTRKGDKLFCTRIGISIIDIEKEINSFAIKIRTTIRAKIKNYISNYSIQITSNPYFLKLWLLVTREGDKLFCIL